MKGRRWIPALLVTAALVPWIIEFCTPARTSPSNTRTAPDTVLPSARLVTVRPAELGDVLYNPGMGFADSHFGIGPPLPSAQHPRSTVAYVRWAWADLEPAEGQYNFDVIDRVIGQARAIGETLAFRVMTEPRVPQWLLDKGVASVKVSGGIFVDYNNPIFLDYHDRLITALGRRYSGSADIDHVDIGSVGCWGEWNTACCHGAEVEALCKRYFPNRTNQIAVTESYLKSFPKSPLVMLVGGPLKYAVSRGTGWRGDCFGDYGMFRPDWNHMENVYAPAARDPVIGNAWKTGPVQFEVCGVMQDWYDRGFDIDLILRKGLQWHASVVNAGWAPVPAPWRPRVDEFLKKLGYRIVLRAMTHQTEATPGGTLLLRSRWENVGVAPFYHPWPLAYRLRSSLDQVVAQWVSTANLMRWLPGAPHEVEEIVTVPAHVAESIYSLDVAILTQDGRSAHVDLAIEGKRPDRWYAVSKLTVDRQVRPKLTGSVGVIDPTRAPLGKRPSVPTARNLRPSTERPAA